MAADDTPSSVLRSRVYRIKHIAPDQAKQILTDLKLGNEISLLQQNAMIVTAYSSADLVKATAVIGLVDSKTAYEIRTFGIPAQMLSEIQDKTLTVEVESLQVGTLRDAPMSKTEPGAIIDIHNGQLLVIAPKASMDKIAQEVVRLEEPYITKPSEGTAEKTATVEQILPATASATKVEPLRLMPDGWGGHVSQSDGAGGTMDGIGCHGPTDNRADRPGGTQGNNDSGNRGEGIGGIDCPDAAGGDDSGGGDRRRTGQGPGADVGSEYRDGNGRDPGRRATSG